MQRARARWASVSGACGGGNQYAEGGLAVFYGDGDAPGVPFAGDSGLGAGYGLGGEGSRVRLGDVGAKTSSVGEFGRAAFGMGQVYGNVLVPVAFDYFAAYFAGEVVHVGGEGEDDASDLQEGSLFMAGGLIL